MTMPTALTDGQLEDIAARNPNDGDIHALLQEIERLSDRLADTWIALDGIAHGNVTDTAGIAQAVLRHQKAPGWKD